MRFRSVAFAAILVALALTGCETPPGAAETCAVYRSFFEQLPDRNRHAFRARSEPNMLAMHHVEIEPPGRFVRGAGLLAPDPDGALASFDADTAAYFDQLHNNPAIDLSTCFPREAPSFIQPTENVERVVDGANNEILSIWTLSPVAISPDGNRALIAGGMYCGGVCGGGAYYLFEKSGDAWTLVGHDRLWVS